MDWLLIELQNKYSRQLTAFHFVPYDDYRPHSDVGCWCKPEQDETGVYVHRSMDGREAFETGERLVS